MRKDKVRRGGPVDILKEPYMACWEEADYADECRPAKKLKRPLRSKEDSYVDFSDIVRR